MVVTESALDQIAAPSLAGRNGEGERTVGSGRWYMSSSRQSLHWDEAKEGTSRKIRPATQPVRTVATVLGWYEIGKGYTRT